MNEEKKRDRGRLIEIKMGKAQIHQVKIACCKKKEGKGSMTKSKRKSENILSQMKTEI